MFKRAEKHGPGFYWVNPITHGNGAEILMDALRGYVKQQTRLDNKVFIFDTLKKFLDFSI